MRAVWGIIRFALILLLPHVRPTGLRLSLKTNNVPLYCTGTLYATYFIATPPHRGWQRNEGLFLLHSFLSLDIFCSVLDT